MELTRPIPWRRVADWTCLACGLCCERFRVRLGAAEAAALVRAFGPSVVEAGPGGLRLRKVEGRCVFLSPDGRCLLQGTGLKPKACRLWPFQVLPEPEFGAPREASFRHLGREWFVYVDPRCPGVRLGAPSDRLKEEVLPEAVEIFLGLRGEQEATTAPVPPPGGVPLPGPASGLTL